MKKSDSGDHPDTLKEKNTEIKGSKGKPKPKTKKSQNNWIYVIFGITFLLSILMGLFSNLLVSKVNVLTAIFILLFIILIGILFDMIGMSVASADEAPLHAKASKKNVGAKEAIKLVKYSEKVSSVCNDVVGDVCGVISGAVSTTLAIKIAEYFKLDNTITALLLGAVVASLTVFGKAIGKTIAGANSENILYKVGAIIHYINPIKEKNKKKKK